VGLLKGIVQGLYGSLVIGDGGTLIGQIRRDPLVFLRDVGDENRENPPMVICFQIVAKVVYPSDRAIPLKVYPVSRLKSSGPSQP
jgi:hypothetical protein